MIHVKLPMLDTSTGTSIYLHCRKSESLWNTTSRHESVGVFVWGWRERHGVILTHRGLCFRDKTHNAIEWLYRSQAPKINSMSTNCNLIFIKSVYGFPQGCLPRWMSWWRWRRCWRPTPLGYACRDDWGWSYVGLNCDTVFVKCLFKHIFNTHFVFFIFIIYSWLAVMTKRRIYFT